MTKSPHAIDAAGLLPGPLQDDHRRLLAGDHPDAHHILGAHPATVGGQRGIVVRAFHPDATEVACQVDGAEMAMQALGRGGLFGVFLPGASLPLSYRLRFRFAGGADWERDDPYRFTPTMGEVDLHLFNEGTHRRLWERLGARCMTHQGVAGTAFAVWAPNARRVSLVGDFCLWDGRLLPMRQLGCSGVYELFVPDVTPGALYKFEIKTREGNIRLKTDPMAASMEHPPLTASRVYKSDYTWRDEAWIAERTRRDITRSPMAVYEVDLGSWRRVPEDNHRRLSYREIAPLLVEHVQRYGFTHLELMPLAEHAFAGSWGYQVTGYYAPTARYGTPDDLRFFVDYCHQHGLGVLLDWVPAHFPRDDFALRRFDGTALYEHADPRLGEHPDWGTLVFNYGRNEVRNFLLANALYWLEEFHIDGLRVDAVASMLYLDYSRKEGEWIPNRYGGKENIEAISLLRSVNEAVAQECPGCCVVAEESTGWSGVTRPAAEHGLGFTFKWNMGWMHDTLQYFTMEPVHRCYHHNDLTFSMLYEYSERFINPLSHDEVVHGKRSLLEKMPGDYWQKFANLRSLLAYQYTRPGKKLLFMGTELAPHGEWHYDASLDWHLADDPMRKGLSRFMEALGKLYLSSPCLWRNDPDPGGFSWIDCHDHLQSVYAYARWDGDDWLMAVLNLTPVPRDDYRVGAPLNVPLVNRMSSDDTEFGGSGYAVVPRLVPEPVPHHGCAQSVVLRLPPLSAIVLVPER